MNLPKTQSAHAAQRNFSRTISHIIFDVWERQGLGFVCEIGSRERFSYSVHKENPLYKTYLAAPGKRWYSIKFGCKFVRVSPSYVF